MITYCIVSLLVLPYLFGAMYKQAPVPAKVVPIFHKNRFLNHGKPNLYSPSITKGKGIPRGVDGFPKRNPVDPVPVKKP